jgi:hypothetical protein
MAIAVEKQILDWAQQFRAAELTVEDVQERFAALDVSESKLPENLNKAIWEAKRLLGAIRFSLCEAGQYDEIVRIFVQLQQLIAEDQQRSPRSGRDDKADAA